jgi:alanyl-tRNA synthetase
MPNLTPPLTSAAVRQSFLDYFAEMGHTIVPSASLVPAGDATLLFTNSGMVQFKDVFLNAGARPYTRVADSQKCMRVAGKHNDLEDVGRDDSHHTFFEMLGNWSFGDYYKEQAITWAWDLLTHVWGLPKDRLWATCFEDEHGVIPRDDEAADLWRRQPGFDPTHLLFFGRKENFWEMADVGPCGPDSEIHYDRGPEYCDMQGLSGHVCRVNGDCQRFLELWNLVFIQYNRLNATDLEPLPNKHVDTGMGLDRVVSVLQNVDSNYKTDLFSPLLDTVQKMLGHTDAERAANFTPYRVIADHARAAAFLIADGVAPGNTGRNYVTRMIIRRAARFGRKLGFDEPFLAEVAATVVREYGHAYPELVKNSKAITRTLTQEEVRFQRTVDLGTEHLDRLIAGLTARGEHTLDGDTAFELYSTYGLPLEITRDILQERNLAADEPGFRAAMDAHKTVSGAGPLTAAEASGEAVERYRQLLAELQFEGALGAEVEYDPYGPLTAEEPVAALLVNGRRVQTAATGDPVEVVMGRTPFYIEMGGQVGDTGAIRHLPGDAATPPQWEIRVDAASRPVAGLIVLAGAVVRGSPAEGDRAIAEVDERRRWDIMRNHTATHLLHTELRAVLGEHANQAGSLVAPDRLRFDFRHDAAVSPDELADIARRVNADILANHPVRTDVQSQSKAKSEGAMALFTEKYGDVVRTIKIGADKPFSYELCGGTHVRQTADIGPFVFIGESSVGAGLRRVEAVTGRGALELIEQRLALLETTAARLRVPPEQLAGKVAAMMDEAQAAQKEKDRLQRELAQIKFEATLMQAQDVNGIVVLAAVIEDVSADTLRELTDRFRQRVPSGVAVLGAAIGGRASLVASVSDDLTQRGLDANKIVKAVAKTVGGSGGGKATLAQAGGKDPSRLAEALAQVAGLVAETLATA